MSLILALMLQASVAAPSTANCTGARQGEVCTEEGRAALRAALDVKPLQAETADGVEVYRAFYLEGGGGLPAVAFVRRPGHSPSVEVSSGANRKMTADVPQEVWRQIQQAGDELLVPVEVRTPAPIDVCMDGGAIFAEIGLPSPDNRSRARIKQLSSSSCESNAIVSFARLAAKLAEPLFPACAAISGEAAPDGVFRLSIVFDLAATRWRRLRSSVARGRICEFWTMTRSPANDWSGGGLQGLILGPVFSGQGAIFQETASAMMKAVQPTS